MKYEDEENEKNDVHDEMIQYFEEMTLSNFVTALDLNLISASLNDLESDELFLVQDIEFITSVKQVLLHRFILY